MLEDPGRASRLWYIRSLSFGPLAGVLLSVAVNHGHPGWPALVALVPLLVIFSVFVSVTLDIEPWRQREVSIRVAAVLVGGSVLFVLPRFLTLAASGEFWQSSVVLRLLICTLPYPLVARLIRPRQQRGRAPGAWAALVVIAASWPFLLAVTLSLSAQQVCHRAGEPRAMFLMINTPARYPASGYTRAGEVLWMAYDSAGGPGESGLDYDPDDLDMYIIPADQPTPCVAIGPDMQLALGIAFPESSRCTHPALNLWSIVDAPEDGAVTDIERYQGYYVALSVDAASANPLSPSALPGLFATLHPATDAEIAHAGNFNYWGWL
jgi:hypothetical protein